jgi:hypothetical protein
MIIGISGKIGSGKDTVGKIIQYLTLDDVVFSKTNVDIIADLEHNGYCANKSNWRVKRFAGKVKEICSMLTSIPVADFEKQEVKDRVLGEEWDKKKRVRNYTKYKYGSGFDTVIQHLTVRQLLQQVGTDAMRNVIHPNVWVNALFADYIGKDYSTCSCVDTNPDRNCQHLDVTEYPNWIITDTRFPNEAEAIKRRGGLLIRVNRESQADRFAKQDSDKTKYHHPSETALDSYTGFDEVLDNNDTIEELIEKVKQILIKHKII